MWSKCAALLVAFAAVSAVVAQDAPASPSQAQWYGDYVRGSRAVRLPDGRHLRLYCTGKGAPTVIMEAGLSENALTWWKVQPRIVQLSRVCVYDRAGLGLSPPGPLPRDTKSEVADLEQLLRAAHLKPPYLLVGHSMGGYNMRLFASRHLRDVAGMVLIDPSSENQLPILEAAVPAIKENDQRSMRRAKACADPSRSPDIVKYCVRKPPEDFPPDLAKTFVEAQGLHTSQTIYSEGQSLADLDSQQVIAARRSLGAMPFLILTRGEVSKDMSAEDAATEARLWTQMHEETAKLSTVGANRIVPGAGHYIHIDKPDAVVDAVSEVLAAARKPRGQH